MRSEFKLNRGGADFIPPLLCAVLLSCDAPRHDRAISLSALERAPSATINENHRFVIEDSDALRGLYRPIGKRAGFIEIRTQAQWDQFRRACPSCPSTVDWHRCTILALATWVGEPMDGRFPLKLAGIRTVDGAAMVSYTIAGGNYRPDGATYVDIAYADGVDSVVLVEVNGVRFYTQ